jgi:pilus assembly protein Flp/PilA
MSGEPVGPKAEQGATAVEYGLMLALVAAVIIGAVRALGQTTTDLFNSVIGTF